jgi:sialidase-1
MVCNVAWAETTELSSLLTKLSTWYNAAGNAVTSGWTNKVVTNTSPVITIQGPEGENVIGWSTSNGVRRPWLKAGYSYTITVPEFYGFTGYTLITQSTTVDNKSTFTYTTSEGQVESVTQQTSDSKVTITGLEKIRTITLDLTNYTKFDDHGVLISGLDVTVETDLITTLDNWNNNFAFKVFGERGFIYATDAATPELKGTNSVSTTYDKESNYHHFALVKYEDKFYLYNIGAQKFVIRNGNNGGGQGVALSDLPTQSVTISAASNLTTNYDWVMNLNGANVHLSNGGGHTYGIRCASGEDEGTRWAFLKTSDFDASAVEAKIATYVNTITDVNQLANTGVYKVYGDRGFIYATENGELKGTNIASVEYDATNPFHNFAILKEGENYYLYNIGAQKFVIKEGDTATLSDTPAHQTITLGAANNLNTDYDWVIRLNGSLAHLSNAATNGVYTNSNTQDEGTRWGIYKTGSFNPDNALYVIRNYNRQLFIQTEVENLENGNPNTHFGDINSTSASGAIFTTKLKRNATATMINYNGLQSNTISFTRPYRGFEFQGFYVGEESLGKSFTLTEDLKTSITEANPIIAKFTATSDVTLFYDDDPFSYRIPAITTTGTGRIVAVSDYRHNLDDIGRDNHGTGTKRIDLVMRYSDNNGETWSETQTIAAGDNSQTGSYLRAFGDAAIAAVGQNIVVMAAAGDQLYPDATTASPNKMARIFSSDNGETWTITEMTTKMYTATGLIPDGVAAFFGSGKLVVDANYNDTQKARIYGALLVRTYIDGKYDNYNNYVVYSDDLGETWAILGGCQTPIAKGDEPKVEILPNGQILLSARRGGGRIFNVFTYTDKANNAGTWDTAANGCGNGGKNATNGEIFCVDAKKVDGTAVKLLMQSQPKGGGGQYDRKDVTIWYKEIDANTTYTTATIKDNWTEGLQVSSQQSSYSAVTMQPNGKIALFFEEAPCYADDYTKGYSMVYVPLTIENITKGNYFAPTTDLNETRTINVKLTDAEGNVYNDVIEGTIAGIGEAVTTKYSFITLGDNAGINVEGETYTYTNSVTLPFKVSNSETTIWHNIYFPSYNNPAFNPIYLSAESNNATVKTCKENVPYGESSFNTLEHADEISWAIYQSGNGFNFKFKNKLVDKYIKATKVDNTSNTVFDEESKATTFEIMSVPGVANNRKAGYALKAIVGGTVGYLSCTSSGNGYATHYSSHEHAGGRVLFVEAPDFEALIAEVNAVLNLFGDGLGQYSNVSDENLNAVNEAKEDMANASSVNKSVLDTYKNYEEKTDGATLNMPQPGQYFRVAYDYGGSVGKLYMQGVASTVKGVNFTEETNNTSVWVYNDGTLTSYYDGRNLREVDDDRGLSDTKTTVNIIPSTRAKGKYNITCTSYIHANSNGSDYFTDHCSSNGHATHDLILEEAEVAVEDVLIGDWEIGTFYANGAMEIPEGVSAYVATAEPVMEEETGVITLTKIQTGVVPAKTGVIITGKPGHYDFTSITSGASIGENFMCGYAGPETMKKVTLTNDASYYILTVVNQTPGFYKKAYDFNVYNNKAYLKLPTTVAASLRFRFNNNDGTTDIIEVPTEALNGYGEIYDLSGRRVEKAGKGVYIVNGKKVIF